MGWTDEAATGAVGSTLRVPHVADVTSGDLTDAALLIAMARGDQSALAVAYERHGAGVYALVCRMCGPRQAVAVSIGLFRALWDAPEMFYSDGVSLAGLLLAEAHRRAVLLLRSGAVPRRALEATMRPEDVERTILLSQPDERMPWMLLHLSDACRKAITYAYLGGYTYRQAAILLQLPADTARADIGAGLRRLRKLTDQRAG